MQSPPLKEKPQPPLVVLPVPRRKGRAVLFVVVPMFIGGVVGGVIGWVAQWLLRAPVGWFFVAGFAFLGALIGIRTLFMVLSYGASHSHDEHCTHASHGE